MQRGCCAPTRRLLLHAENERASQRAAGGRLSLDAPTQAATLASRCVSAAVAGKTALHLAAERGLGSLAARLLAAGASAAPTDDDGRTPLHYAAAYGHVVHAVPGPRWCRTASKQPA